MEALCLTAWALHCQAHLWIEDRLPHSDITTGSHHAVPRVKRSITAGGLGSLAHTSPIAAVSLNRVLPSEAASADKHARHAAEECSGATSRAHGPVPAVVLLLLPSPKHPPPCTGNSLQAMAHQRRIRLQVLSQECARAIIMCQQRTALRGRQAGIDEANSGMLQQLNQRVITRPLLLVYMIVNTWALTNCRPGRGTTTESSRPHLRTRWKTVFVVARPWV